MRRDFRRIALVEANRNDTKILARDGIGTAQSSGQPVELRRADSATSEVIERQNRGAIDERTKTDWIARLIAQHQIEQRRLAQFLIDPDLAGADAGCCLWRTCLSPECLLS